MSGTGSINSANASSQASSAESVVETVGQPGPEHVAYAEALYRSIPDDLLATAHSAEDAWLLALALLIDPVPDTASRQFDLLTQQIGAERVARVHRYYDAAERLGATYALPLLELSFPALRQGTDQKREYLLDTGRRLVELDGEIDLREYCLFRLLSKSLRHAQHPAGRTESSRASRKGIRQAATGLLRVLARHGGADPAAQTAAFAAGLSHFGKWSRTVELGEPQRADVITFGAALSKLGRMGTSAKETLIRAATATVLHDERVTAREAEMLRTVCAALECPMPPILGVEAGGA